MNDACLGKCARIAMVLFHILSLLFVQNALVTATSCDQLVGSEWPTHFTPDCETMSIQNTPITDMPSGSLDGMTKLTELAFLYCNELVHLPDIGAVAGTLHTLELRGNAKLTDLPVDILSDLLALKVLYLSHNPLLSFLPDASGPKLSELDISNSGFQQVPLIPNMGKEIVVSFVFCLLFDC